MRNPAGKDNINTRTNPAVTANTVIMATGKPINP